MARDGVNMTTASADSRTADAALVDALARGDRLAMALLYDRYAPLLLALASRILGCRVHAEDVLHDALLEAWHRASEYDPARGSVRAWLVTRVRSRALDERIGAARRARLLRDNRNAFDMGPQKAPELHGDDGNRVRRELACLPADLAAVVDLAYFEGLSASAIGLRLGIPSGTVKSRLARAMVILRRHLGTGTETGGPD